MQFYTTAATMI